MGVCRSLRGSLAAQVRCQIVLIVANVLCLAPLAGAGLVDFKAKTWDPGEQHLLLNGNPVQESAGAVLPGMAGFVPVTDMADKVNPTAMGYSGAGADDPLDFQIFQHVATWSLPTSDYAYTAQNQTGHDRTFVLTSEELGTNRRAVRLRSNVILSGSLLMARHELFSGERAFRDMLASFEVEITRENGRRQFFGRVELVGRPNGSIAVRTRGQLRPAHISAIIEDGDILEVVLDNVAVPYTTRVKLGQEFTLSTRMTSKVVNVGDGTGAEVIFGPDEAMLPGLMVQNAVPEPATIALLAMGAWAGVFRRRRRFGK